MHEWTESAYDGVNDLSFENRAVRGGSWANAEANLRSSSRPIGVTTNSANNVGFRVASVPEPSTWAMLGLGLPALLAFRRRVQA